MRLVHTFTHRHECYARAGLGRFHLCSPRLPDPKVHIWFRPEGLDPIWHQVPYLRDSDGVMCFERMLHAPDAAAAMAVLHAANQGDGFA